MIRTPKPRIVVMTVCQATEDIRFALTAGAKGYLLKEAEPDELWDTIRKVFAGDVVLPLTVSGKLAASLAA
jgi:two-component system, NarL family, response regulator